MWDAWLAPPLPNDDSPKWDTLKVSVVHVMSFIAPLVLPAAARTLPALSFSFIMLS